MMTGFRTLLPCLVALSLVTSAQAEGIRRIVHPDGTVEFTNTRAPDAPLASTRSETVYRYTDANGVVSYSSIRPRDAEFDVIRFHCYAWRPEL